MTRWIAIAAVVCACFYGGPPPQPQPTQPQQQPPPPQPQAQPMFASPPPPSFASPPPQQQPVPVPATTAAPAACGKDQIFETICGGVAPPQVAGACGPTGDALTSFGKTRVAVSVSSRMANDPALRGFALDDAATRAYQREMAAHGLARPTNYCCYSRCSPIAVAARAPTRVAPPGHSIHQRCIPAPRAGTAVPARLEPRCPAAVALDGTPSPLVDPATSRAGGYRNAWWFDPAGAACCYEVVRRDPPPNDGHCPTCKCAAAGTLVATPAGEVPIESLAPGDRVLSMHRGALTAVPIARTSRTPARDHEMVVVTLASGRTLAMSPLHPTADGRRFADLEPGAPLGGTRVVTLRRAPYAGGFTYDLLPDSDSGTYVAAGALVGSTLR